MFKFLILAVCLAATIAGTPPTPTPSAPVYECPPNFDLELTSLNTPMCLHVSAGEKKYFDAQKHCESMHGDLAWIDTPEENHKISQIASIPYTLWIGLNDNNNEGYWEWISGHPIEYQNWALGQPDDWGSHSGENCVSMYDSAGPGQWRIWNDLRCNKELKYVCRAMVIDKCAPLVHDVLTEVGKPTIMVPPAFIGQSTIRYNKASISVKVPRTRIDVSPFERILLQARLGNDDGLTMDLIHHPRFWSIDSYPRCSYRVCGSFPFAQMKNKKTIEPNKVVYRNTMDLELMLHQGPKYPLRSQNYTLPFKIIFPRSVKVDSKPVMIKADEKLGFKAAIVHTDINGDKDKQYIIIETTVAWHYKLKDCIYIHPSIGNVKVVVHPPVDHECTNEVGSKCTQHHKVEISLKAGCHISGDYDMKFKLMSRKNLFIYVEDPELTFTIEADSLCAVCIFENFEAKLKLFKDPMHGLDLSTPGAYLVQKDTVFAKMIVSADVNIQRFARTTISISNGPTVKKMCIDAFPTPYGDNFDITAPQGYEQHLTPPALKFEFLFHFKVTNLQHEYLFGPFPLNTQMTLVVHVEMDIHLDDGTVRRESFDVQLVDSAAEMSLSNMEEDGVDEAADEADVAASETFVASSAFVGVIAVAAAASVAMGGVIGFVQLRKRRRNLTESTTNLCPSTEGSAEMTEC